MECCVGQNMMLTQCPSHGALYVRSHDTYTCFYTYGSPNKHVVIVSLARSVAQDRNNITLSFEEIWMLSRKNTGLIASIIKEYQTDSISKILPSFRLRDNIISGQVSVMPQVAGQWFLEQFPPKQHRRTLFILHGFGVWFFPKQHCRT